MCCTSTKLTSIDLSWRELYYISANTFSSNLKNVILSPANIYLSKVNNEKNSRKRCEICSKLTIKTTERRQWRRSGVFIVNFEHISHLFLVLLLLTLNRDKNRYFYHPIQTNLHRLKFIYTNVIMYSFIKPFASTLLFYFYYLPIHVTAISQKYAILCVIWYLLYNFKKREKYRERMKEKKRERVLTFLHECFSRFSSCANGTKSRKGMFEVFITSLRLFRGVFEVMWKKINVRQRCIQNPAKYLRWSILQK